MPLRNALLPADGFTHPTRSPTEFLNPTGGAHATRIRAAELAQIVSGNNPHHRRLSEAGFWVRIGARYPNPAVTLNSSTSHSGRPAVAGAGRAR